MSKDPRLYDILPEQNDKLSIGLYFNVQDIESGKYFRMFSLGGFLYNRQYLEFKGGILYWMCIDGVEVPYSDSDKMEAYLAERIFGDKSEKIRIFVTENRLSIYERAKKATYKAVW